MQTEQFMLLQTCKTQTLFHCLSSALLSYRHCLGVLYLPGVDMAMSIFGKKEFRWEHDNATGSKKVLLCLGGQNPEAYTVVVVCVCKWVGHFARKLFAFSLWSLKIKNWNMHCKLNAVLSWNEISKFWISSFIVKLWHDLPTSTAVASNPEFIEEQISHNRLLINMTVQSVQQIRRWPKWNPENETGKATQPKFCLPQHNTDHVQLKAQPNLAPTLADYLY